MARPAMAANKRDPVAAHVPQHRIHQAPAFDDGPAYDEPGLTGHPPLIGGLSRPGHGIGPWEKPQAEEPGGDTRHQGAVLSLRVGTPY